MAPLVCLILGSVLENDYLKGLVALIMVAVQNFLILILVIVDELIGTFQLEHVVISLLKPQTQIKEFSKALWGSKVEVYCMNLHNINDTHWVELLEACRIHSGDSEGESDSVDDKNVADLSLLDNNRTFVFNFCSPTKAHV